MSATRDKNQKVAFVYSNLYQIYKKGGTSVSASAGVKTTPVLKSQDLHAKNLNHPTFGAVKVNNYTPVEILSRPTKTVKKPEVLKQSEAAQAPASALDSLKQNLNALNDLHARLRFMLQELEDLVKDS